MKHGSLFSGIGGFDLAAEWAGWTNVFNCEIDPFCQKILKYYWPDAEQYTDIRAADFTIWRGRIDVLTGGFPCQPFSLAGKRKGTDDERHLWPEMFRAICEIRPRWIVGENVFGIINWSDGLVFEQVCADLESEGYEVQPYIIPAAGVGAPHKRDRVWFVAKNTECVRRNGSERQKESGSGRFGESGAGGNEWVYGEEGVNPNSSGRKCQTGDKQRCGHGRQNRPQDKTVIHNRTTRPCYTQNAVNTTGVENKRWRQSGFQSEYTGVDYENAWGNFPTQPPICSGNDELSGGLDGITFPKWRQESIKGFGNAVVPQLVLQIFETINEFDNLPT